MQVRLPWLGVRTHGFRNAPWPQGRIFTGALANGAIMQMSWGRVYEEGHCDPGNHGLRVGRLSGIWTSRE
jgi:hypothetical protein